MIKRNKYELTTDTAGNDDASYATTVAAVLGSSIRPASAKMGVPEQVSAAVVAPLVSGQQTEPTARSGGFFADARNVCSDDAGCGLALQSNTGIAAQAQDIPLPTPQSRFLGTEPAAAQVWLSDPKFERVVCTGYPLPDKDYSAKEPLVLPAVYEVEKIPVYESPETPAVPEPEVAPRIDPETPVTGEPIAAPVIESNSGRDRMLESSKALSAGEQNYVMNALNNLCIGNGLDNVIDGNALQNFIRGEGGNDTLNGKQDSDYLWGGQGSDTFVFERGTGRDVIFDFEVGVDKILLVDSLFSNLDDVKAHLNNFNVLTRLDLGAGDEITLMGVAAANLTAADFVFAG